jgi:hypothetical protein
MFTSKDIKDLPSDEADAGLQICEKLLAAGSSVVQHQQVEALATAYDFLNAFLHSIGMPPGPRMEARSLNEMRNTVLPFVQRTHRHFKGIVLEREADKQKMEFARGFGEKYKKDFAYEFTDGDVSAIQKQIDSLRIMIVQSKYMDDGFRSRLLKRLEKLQGEFHKRMSDLDRFWGLMGDAGVALGRFGNDAKPFFNRVRELLETVWRTQARAEELPTNSPLPELGQEES